MILLPVARNAISKTPARYYINFEYKSVSNII